MTAELVFRGMLGRTLEDQKLAMENGYRSVAEMAIDQLAEILLELRNRMETLESLYATYADQDFRLPSREWPQSDPPGDQADYSAETP